MTMFFTESIYFLILFTLPAALHVIYHAYIRQTPKINDDKSIELAECIVFCLCVFFINILLMNKEMLKLAGYMLAENRIQYCIDNDFNYVDFIIKYFITNLIVSISIIVIWYACLIKLYRKIINVINKITGKPAEYVFQDTWRNVFESKDIVDVENCILKIEKAGILISAGILKTYPAPHVEHKELVLYNTDLIKELFDDDREKTLDQRVFPYALYEYYDISNDLLIKFYSAEGYDEYCEEESRTEENGSE